MTDYQQGYADGAVDLAAATVRAKAIALSIWERHYRLHLPSFKPADDLMGLLEQINTLTDQLERK